MDSHQANVRRESAMKSGSPLLPETFLFRTLALTGIGVWIGLVGYLILRLFR
jgi:hypothetical protein